MSSLVRRANYVIFTIIGILIGIVIGALSVPSPMTIPVSSNNDGPAYHVIEEPQVKLDRGDVKVESGNEVIIRPTNPEPGKYQVRSHCTLTVIDDDYGLTSQHCLSYGKDGLFIKDQYRDLHHLGNVIKTYAPYDLALIKFNDNIIGNHDPLSDDRQEIGEMVSFYGATSGPGQGFVLEGEYENTSFMTSVLVQKGDSGGPLYNADGEIIGIAESTWESGKSNFVIIHDILKDIQDDIS